MAAQRAADEKSRGRKIFSWIWIRQGTFRRRRCAARFIFAQRRRDMQETLISAAAPGAHRVL
jgi:hypothetical protein